jgi:hypothetical protein
MPFNGATIENEGNQKKEQDWVYSKSTRQAFPTSYYSSLLTKIPGLLRPGSRFQSEEVEVKSLAPEGSRQEPR